MAGRFFKRPNRGTIQTPQQGNDSNAPTGERCYSILIVTIIVQFDCAGTITRKRARILSQFALINGSCFSMVPNCGKSQRNVGWQFPISILVSNWTNGW
jgi:hypothetical protein